MIFTLEETKKLKAMMLFLVKKKHNESGGNCGFHLLELREILEELEKDGQIEARETINNNMYFLTNKN